MMKPIRILSFLCLLAAPTAAQNIIPNPGTVERPAIDVESYTIRAEIDPEASELRAEAEIRFVQQDRQSFVLFDLDRRLRVESVLLGETDPLPALFRQFDGDSTIEVDLSELGQFDQPVLRITYAGRLRLNPEDPAPAQLGIDTDRAFLLEEGKWYPMNGVRRDAARMRLELSVPDSWEIVSLLPETGSSGLAVEDPGQPRGESEDAGVAAVEVLFGDPEAEEPPAAEQADTDADAPELLDPDTGNAVADFFNEQPDSGIAAPSGTFSSDTPGLWGTVVAGAFARVEAPFVDGAVESLVSPASSEAAAEVGEAAAELFRFYSEVFGPAASPTLRLIEVGAADWDGQSANGVLLLPTSAFRSDFDQWELAGQVARQWFPLKFVVEDPVADAWISEGMSVFAGLYYFLETLGEDEAHEHVRRTLVKAVSYEGTYTLREAGMLPRGSADFHTLAGYKGAFVFRMLGEVMGRDLFRSFLTEFGMLFADQPVSTRALVELASDVNAEDLGYFFSQWLDEADVPEFDRTYRMLRLSAGGYKIQGEVTQDLDLFSMPVEIEVLTDGEPEYTTVFLAGPSSDIDILTERRPRSVVIDPRMKVLRMSPDIRVAVHISRGEDLVEAGDLAAAIREYQSAIDLDRLSSLAFFRMGEALFEQQSFSFAADVFREALNGDLDPTWVEVWSYINLGKIYDLRIQRDRALIEYRKALSTGDDAYGAQAEAERYIERPFRVN